MIELGADPAGRIDGPTEAVAGAGAGPGRRPIGWLVVATVLSALVFFLQLELRHPGYFLWDDNASEFLPGFVYTYESLSQHGELAQLNYHQYLGYTFLASGQTGVLYPPVYLAMAFSQLAFGDLRHGLDVLGVLHLVLGGVGMLLVLRRLGAQSWVAATMAFLWASSPFFVQLGRSWIHLTFTAAWLPWSFLFLLRLLDRPTAGRIVALAAAKALFFFQGHPHFFLLVAVGEGVFVFCRWLARRRVVEGARQARALGLAALLAAALAAPLILPMWSALEATEARAQPLPVEEFRANALDVGVAAGAQLLQMEPAIHWASGSIYYVGLPHLLALWGLFHAAGRQRRLGLAALAVSVVTWALATESVWGLFYGLPVVSSLRWPFKAFGVGLFYAMLAAAVGYSALARRRSRVRAAMVAAALTLSVAAHVFLVGHGEWDRPLGPNRIDRDVTQIRQETASILPVERGRVVSMWLSPVEPRLERFLAFQYATLAGAYHLGGYEPMIAKRNFELAKGLEYSNIFRYRLTREVLDELSARSVRFLIVPTRGESASTLAAFPELRRVHRDDLLEVWENGRALPFAFFHHAPSRPLPVDFTPGGLEIDTGGRGGRLTVTVASLAGYVWSADGLSMGTVAHDAPFVHLDVPPETLRVSLRYVDLPFRIGVAIAAATLLSLLAVALLRRRRSQGELRADVRV